MSDLIGLNGVERVIPGSLRERKGLGLLADLRGDRRRGCTRLAALPSREVLLAKLAGGMQAPVGTLAGLLASPLRNLGYALQQVADQKAASPGA